MIAVAEAARNVACVGARPRAITNNLNFGNPAITTRYSDDVLRGFGVRPYNWSFDVALHAGTAAALAAA